MKYQVDIQDAAQGAGYTLRAIESAAMTVLEMNEVPVGGSVAILLTDDLALQELNRRFRGENVPTDVLSFPFGDTSPGMQAYSGYLGDIAVSVPYASRQAGEKGHSLEAELQLLVIHGVLHLLGYDHQDEAQKKLMWTAQESALGRLGLSNIQPTE